MAITTTTNEPEFDRQLRVALEANGQRYTEQRSAVYRYLLSTDAHPTADDVFTTVRHDIRTSRSRRFTSRWKRWWAADWL
jgi:Fe2+ or Zn2+ uptake regulation protein